MSDSTRISVSRTAAGADCAVWCDGKPVEAHIVQRSARLVALSAQPGSSDIPMYPAAFWDWVEYSPHDSAMKGTHDLCSLLEAACILRDADTIAATTTALARLYRAELRKDTFDATSSHPPPCTDLQQPLHSNPGPQVARFTDLTTHLLPACWAAIASNLHLYETLPGPLPLLCAALTRTLTHGRLDLSAAFPTSHHGPPVREVIAALAPALALQSTPCISAVTAMLTPQDPPHALSTLMLQLAGVSDVTLYVDPAETYPEGHLHHFLAAFPGNHLTALHILGLPSADGAARPRMHADAGPPAAPGPGPAGNDGTCTGSPEGRGQSAGDRGSASKVAEASPAGPSSGLPGTAATQKRGAAAAPVSPLGRLRSCLDSVVVRWKHSDPKTTPTPLHHAPPHGDTDPPPPSPPSPRADSEPPELPQDCVLRVLRAVAVRPKLAALRSLSIPVSLSSDGDTTAFQKLPISQLSFLHLDVRVRPEFQVPACRALSAALVDTRSLRDLAVRIYVQPATLKMLITALGTLTTLRSLALRQHHEGPAASWPADMLCALSTLSALERLACPPCLPLLPCMPRLTYLEWTGHGVEVPRDVMFTVPMLQEFVLPCALPLHGEHGSLQSLLCTHSHLVSIRCESDCVLRGHPPGHSVASSSDGDPARLCCCQGSAAGATGHMVDDSAWGGCMLRDESEDTDRIPAFGVDVDRNSDHPAGAAHAVHSPCPSDSGEFMAVNIPGCCDARCRCRLVAARSHAFLRDGEEDKRSAQHGRGAALLPLGSSIHAALTTFGAAMPWLQELRLQVDGSCGADRDLLTSERDPWGADQGPRFGHCGQEEGEGTREVQRPRAPELQWRPVAGVVHGGTARLGLTALQRLDLRGVRGVMHCLQQLRGAALSALSALRLSGRQRDAAALLRLAEECEGWPALRELRLGVCVHEIRSFVLRKLKLHWGSEGGREVCRRMRRLERRVLQEVSLRCLHVEHASVSISTCVVEQRRAYVEDDMV